MQSQETKKHTTMENKEHPEALIEKYTTIITSIRREGNTVEYLKEDSSKGCAEIIERFDLSKLVLKITGTHCPFPQLVSVYNATPNNLYEGEPLYYKIIATPKHYDMIRQALGFTILNGVLCNEKKP
ncbi:MAG: hypothetical protein HGB03_01085 [Candidatus Yonathbacteria bacterium]|nr:hypothetical protein [Candidatus Yonathbacteria bacterium]NTW47858.1 hypothetical protein [Candidatus Yonathbacteria bacterium]